jgi:hypothetical protein
MKAFKLVLTGIAIAICAILSMAKQTISTSKRLQPGRTRMQQDVNRRYEKELMASPLAMPIRLPY